MNKKTRVRILYNAMGRVDIHVVLNAAAAFA